MREHSLFTVRSCFFADEMYLRILKSYFSEVSNRGIIEINSWNKDKSISLEYLEKIRKDPGLSCTSWQFNNTTLFSSSQTLSYGSIGLSLEFSLFGIYGELVEGLEEFFLFSDHHRRTIASGSNLE
mgnify:FL=1